MKDRLNWIDWMKVIGMFCIVWGHLFPSQLSNYLYTFNVPLFFIISGFLGGGGYKKLIHSLLIPYCVVCASYLVINPVLLFIDGKLTLANVARSAVYMAMGFQSCPNGFGCNAMWFVFTLMIIKLLFGLLKHWLFLGLLSVVCFVGAVLCQGHAMFWSVQNVLISLPFYYLGWLLATRHKEWFDRGTMRIKHFCTEHNLFTLLFVLIIAFALYWISCETGFIEMYMCGYGNNFGLFICGSLLGSFLIYLISLMLDDRYFSWVRTISTGSIVILAYQYIPIKIYGGVMLWKLIAPYKNNDILTFMVAMTIMLVFIYVIKLTQRYFPLIMGGRRVS